MHFIGARIVNSLQRLRARPFSSQKKKHDSVCSMLLDHISVVISILVGDERVSLNVETYEDFEDFVV